MKMEIIKDEDIKPPYSPWSWIYYFYCPMFFLFPTSYLFTVILNQNKIFHALSGIPHNIVTNTHNSLKNFNKTIKQPFRNISTLSFSTSVQKWHQVAASPARNNLSVISSRTILPLISIDFSYLFICSFVTWIEVKITKCSISHCMQKFFIFFMAWLEKKLFTDFFTWEFHHWERTKNCYKK